MRLAWLNCLLLLCASLLGAGAAVEASTDKLFESEVPVADRTEAERGDAFEFALMGVLKRLMGAGSDTKGAAAGIVNEAAFYVQEYQYRSDTDSEPAPQGTATAEPPPPDTWDTPVLETRPAEKNLRLWVRFDGPALERALRNAGVSYWGTARPSVLTWIAVQQEGTRIWIEGAPQQSTIALRAASEKLGLPLIFPLFDLEDLMQVKLGDVMGGVDQGARDSLARYQAQGVLVGSAIQDARGWNVRWRYYPRGEGESLRWTTLGTGLDDALNSGLTELAARLDTSRATDTARAEPRPPPPIAAAPAIPPPGQPNTLPPANPSPGAHSSGSFGAPASRSLESRPWEERASAQPVSPGEPSQSATLGSPLPAGTVLIVTGVDSIEDYAKLDKYLAGVSAIKAHQPRGIGGGKATFQVEVPSGAEALEKQLAVDGVLRKPDPLETGAAEPSSQSSTTLHFHYVK